MPQQIKKAYYKNGICSHSFVIDPAGIITQANLYDTNGNLISNSPQFYDYKIVNLRYYFWNKLNENDSVAIVDNYESL